MPELRFALPVPHLVTRLFRLFSASVLRVRDSVVFVLANRMVKLKPGSPNKSIVRKQG